VIEKSFQQLRKETEAILDAEKKKLEAKQNKTQQEMETLEQLNITYKLVDGGKDAWKDVPILLVDDKQRYTKPAKKQDKNTIESPARKLESLKQEKANLQRQIKEQDKELALLRNDKQSLQRGNSTVQQQMKTKDDKTTLLQREIQELQLKTNNLEQQGREKESKINVLETEQHGHHRMSIQQTQMLNLLKEDKQTMEQDKTNTTNEMELLKVSNTTLEQLLKSKEAVILSLKRENQTLSSANQGNQQGANEMVEALKNLLQAKASETELLKKNTEHLLANERRRNDALEQEIRALKQERTQQQATIQNTGPSNNSINSTNSNPSHHDHHDDSYHDLNYESEYSGTEYSGTEYGDTEESDDDDINYDTPSEDEDSNNDLNYDDVNESNK
jgi:chromosome segregation ATPase